MHIALHHINYPFQCHAINDHRQPPPTTINRALYLVERRFDNIAEPQSLRPKAFTFCAHLI